MTCVVGLVHRGTVYLGADSMASDGWLAMDSEKLFTRGEFLFGHSGNCRNKQIVEHVMATPEVPHKGSLVAYMKTDFVTALRTACGDEGSKQTKDGVEKALGSLIVGVRGKLFQVDPDFYVSEESVTAIGSGAHFALGALHACRLKDPRMRIRRALEAAEKYSPWVRGPFVIRRER